MKNATNIMDDGNKVIIQHTPTLKTEYYFYNDITVKLPCKQHIKNNNNYVNHYVAQFNNHTSDNLFGIDAHHQPSDTFICEKIYWEKIDNVWVNTKYVVYYKLREYSKIFLTSFMKLINHDDKIWYIHKKIMQRTYRQDSVYRQSNINYIFYAKNINSNYDLFPIGYNVRCDDGVLCISNYDDDINYSNKKQFNIFYDDNNPNCITYEKTFYRNPQNPNIRLFKNKVYRYSIMKTALYISVHNGYKYNPENCCYYYYPCELMNCSLHINGKIISLNFISRIQSKISKLFNFTKWINS